jgi:SAM-dependent methyltransferase
MTDKPYSGTDNLEVMGAAIRYNNFLVKEVLKNVSGSGQRIVDFGAGRGFYAEALREKGLDVICIEADGQLSQKLVERGFEVYKALSEISDESIDYIYSLNVLEHIADDVGAIQKMYSILKPGGKIFLYVPAFEILCSSMDKKVGHYRRYRKKTLSAMLTRAGFEVSKAYYVDSIGFIVTILFRIFGNKKGDINTTVIKFFDRFLFPLSRLTDIVTSGMFGKNAAVVAGKATDDN